MTKANTSDSTTTTQHRRLKVKRGFYEYQGRQPRQQRKRQVNDTLFSTV